MKIPVHTCSILLAMAFAAPASAGPKPVAGKKSTSGAVYSGKPAPARKPSEGNPWQAPSSSERAAIVTGLAGKQVAVAEMFWAVVNVRSPFVHKRAALVFIGADSVDPQRGWARWSAGGASSTLELSQASLHVDLEELFDGAAAAAGANAAGMELWLHASAGHKYAATCRVRLKGSAGDVTVHGGDGFQLTKHVDHAGKAFGKISFLVDPTADGWYGFSIAASKAWATPGCWVEEL